MADGYTYRRPDRTLSHCVYVTVAAAQGEAAFAHAGISCMMLPRDWDGAYAAGYRIVPAQVHVTGASRSKWKVYDNG